MEVGCGNEEPHPNPVFLPWAGRGGDVVQSAAAEEHQTGDPVATVEGDQVLPRWAYFVPLPGFAGVPEVGEAGEEVSVSM